jgi:magnesium chelatase subunit H
MALAMALAEANITPHREAMVMLVDGATTAKVVAASGLTPSAELSTIFDKLSLSIRLMRLNSEIEGLIAALDGRYILPAPGGDILRNPSILPTGRNLHGFDPFKIPSPFAVQDGAQQADKLIERYLQDGHALPESVAIVLWGSDNLKSEGSQIGQV